MLHTSDNKCWILCSLAMSNEHMFYKYISKESKGEGS